MNIPAKASRSILLALLFVGHLTPCCLASTAHVMSVEEMTEAADVVLVGYVESITHHPADPDDVPRMHRKVQVSVESYLKNPLNSSGVTLLLLGATVGNTTMEVSEQPDFNGSDRVLLFLSEDVWFLDENPRGYFQLVNGAQGKIDITADTDLGVFGFDAADNGDTAQPSGDSEKETAVGLLPECHAGQPGHPLVVPMTMAVVLLFMRWRRMIP